MLATTVTLLIRCAKTLGGTKEGWVKTAVEIALVARPSYHWSRTLTEVYTQWSLHISTPLGRDHEKLSVYSGVSTYVRECASVKIIVRKTCKWHLHCNLSTFSSIIIASKKMNHSVSRFLMHTNDGQFHECRVAAGGGRGCTRLKLTPMSVLQKARQMSVTYFFR